MITPGVRAAARAGLRPPAAWLPQALLFGALPTVLLVTLVADVFLTGEVPVEPHAYYRAAEAVLSGRSPFLPVDDAGLIAGDGYVYPPLTALGVIPFTVLPPLTAGAAMMLLGIGAVLAIPYVLGVRDWRCYGLVFLWPPVVLGAQTGNVNALLALSAALAWCFRDRAAISGALVGLAFAQKLMLWPLAVWMAATRRVAAAAWAALSAAALLLGTWALIGFEGLGEYPNLARRVSALMDDRGYSVYAILADLGAPETVARAAWLAVALSLLAAVILVSRRGADRTAFVLAVVASLAVTPVAWLHYFVFLVVVCAVTRPRLGAAWFLPLLMFLTEGGMNPGPLETGATLAVAAATVLLALRTADPPPRPAHLRSALRSTPAAETA